jgi:hypothetical protein
MKIEGRRQQIRAALEQGADAASLKKLMDTTGATAADVKSVLDELGDKFASDKRSTVEKLLGFTGETPTLTGAEGPASGRRVHDVRAEKKKPWWSGLANPGAPIHPEPARDVDVHGERFSKDDVTSLLRSIGR